MRSLKIYEAGKRNETLWQILRDNIRFPEASLGDLRAQIAACNIGVRRYGELLSRYGRDDGRGLRRGGLGSGRSGRTSRRRRPSRTANMRPRAFSTMMGAISMQRLRIKVKVIVSGASHDGGFQ